MRSRIAPATALFITLAILNSFPLVLHLGTSIGQHGDSYFSVWRLAWVAHQLTTDPAHLFDGNIFYPHHTTLAYSDAMLLPAVMLAPLAWAGIPPVVVYNLALLAAFVASAVAAFLLVRELTGSVAAGLLGGIIFGFSPHRLEHFDHLELQFAFWMPLAALAWHRAIDKDRGYLTAGLFAAGQVMSSIYHGVFLVTWLGVLTGIRLLRDPRRAVRAGVLVLAPPLLVLAIYSIPYMRSRAELGDRPPTDVASYSAVPSDFLSAPRNNRLYGWTEPIGANERHLFPGVVATLLLIVGLWPPYDRTRLLHAAGLALALELTLGFNGGLYQLLYEWVLPFRGLRVPARADILVLLGTAGTRRLRLDAPQAFLRAAYAGEDHDQCRDHADLSRVPGCAYIDPRPARAVSVVRMAQDRARRRGLRMAGDSAMAPVQHGGRQIHVLVHRTLASTAERLQRLLPGLLHQAAVSDAFVPRHRHHRGTSTPRSDDSCPARVGDASLIHRRRRTPDTGSVRESDRGRQRGRAAVDVFPVVAAGRSRQAQLMLRHTA